MAAIPAGCDLAYPEVVVVNRTAEHVLLRNPSFNGCAWNVVLGYGEATSPGFCLPGEDRVHFQTLDAAQYCRDQAEDRTLSCVCPCDGGGADGDGGTTADADPASSEVEPLWFNYQTISVHRVDYRDFVIFKVTLDDMEQDFSVPGPYGH